MFVMPLQESESIILKTYPLAEADRIVVFFSREFGKVRGVANGVRRIKNSFGASLEPLARSRVTFFQKETRELVRIRSCELLDSPMKLFEDYDRALLAGHIADLVDRFLPDHEAHDAVFRLFDLARRSLAAGIPLDLARCYFEIWILRLTGVLPDIFRCSFCLKVLDQLEARLLLPGLTSVACRSCGAGSGTQITQATITALWQILTNSLDSDEVKAPQEGLHHLQQLNKVWIERYFER